MEFFGLHDVAERHRAEPLERKQCNIRRGLGVRHARVPEHDIHHVFQTGGGHRGIRALLRLAGDDRQAEVRPFQFLQPFAHAWVEELWNPGRHVRPPEHAIDLHRLVRQTDLGQTRERHHAAVVEHRDRRIPASVRHVLHVGEPIGGWVVDRASRLAKKRVVP